MSHHHHHHHQNKHCQCSPETVSKPTYRNKWFIFAAILMLIGMIVYVLTLDESVIPEVVPDVPSATTNSQP